MSERIQATVTRTNNSFWNQVRNNQAAANKTPGEANQAKGPARPASTTGPRLTASSSGAPKPERTNTDSVTLSQEGHGGGVVRRLRRVQRIGIATWPRQGQPGHGAYLQLKL